MTVKHARFVASASLLALGFAPAISFAQEGAAADAASSDDSGDIVVTAQRRQERVQDIPVAISAFGSDQIERGGIASLESIAPRVPSFYFGSFGAARPQLYIRGIGTRSFDPGSESSVGVFADDVYLGRSSGSFGAMKDIERVEVLRGPQGTLYGRNTIGGAINVISKAPSDELTGNFEAGISNFGGYNVFGALGGPIAGDKLMVRIAGWREERDGYVTNTATGHRFQGIENTGGRIRATIAPVEPLKIDLTAEWMKDGNKAAFGGLNQGTSGAPASVFFRGSGTASSNSDLRRGALSSDPFLDREVKSYIGRVEYDAGGATMTAISALRLLDIKDGRDLEGSSLDILDQSSVEHSRQFTQELRIASNPGDSLSFGGLVDWIIGGFYYHDTSNRTDSFRVGLNSAVRAAAGTPATDVALSDYKIESYAVFGQATFHLTDALDVTVGGRYSHDSKRATQAGTTTDAAPIIAAPFTTTNSAKYESFDPRIVVAYKLSSDANVYASFSTGFKSGGFQYVPFSKGQADVLFSPEDIKAYEIGFKSEWLDRALRINGAAYYYDYKNLQISRIILPAGSTAPVSLISNAASSTIKGVDLEITARPSRHFEVNIAYGYLDAKYDKYVFNATTDFSDTRMVRAPEHSINIGAEWRVPVLDDGEFSLRADYALVGDFFHEPGQGNIVYGTGIPLTSEDGYGLLDLRATLSKGNLKLTVYATNLGNTKYRRTINALGNTVVGFAGAPRIFGAKVGYSF